MEGMVGGESGLMESGQDGSGEREGHQSQPPDCLWCPGGDDRSGEEGVGGQVIIKGGGLTYILTYLTLSLLSLPNTVPLVDTLHPKCWGRELRLVVLKLKEESWLG